MNVSMYTSSHGLSVSITMLGLKFAAVMASESGMPDLRSVNEAVFTTRIGASSG